MKVPFEPVFVDMFSGKLVLKLDPPHQQVLPYFPQYALDSMMPGTIIDYSNPNNVTGHQQRGLIVAWALRAFTESGGYPGVDFGGAGVLTPGCISVDLCGSGDEHGTYGGHYTGVHIKADAAHLENFGSDSFSCVLSSHLVEHLPCTRLHPGSTPPERLRTGCPGFEVAPILREWIRIVRPGGLIAGILPDEAAARRGGSSVFFQDESHQHAWTAQEFYDNVLMQLLDTCELEDFDSLKNNFSFQFCLRKK